MVAIAMGIIAATAIRLGFGRVNIGSAKNPLFAVSGKTLKKLIPVMSLITNAVKQPRIGPKSNGSCPATPFRYTENRMVEINVTREITQARFLARASSVPVAANNVSP